MKFFKIVAIISVGLLLQGCSGMSKQGGGTLIGGALGGLVGSRFGGGGGNIAATGLGVIAGAFIGNQIGKSMDEQDKLMLERSSQKALENAPSGSSVEWRNPDSGHYGSVTPTRTFNNTAGRYCREYVQTVVIGGKEEKAYGKACRQPDGQWQIIQ
jgi:surface antigen